MRTWCSAPESILFRLDNEIWYKYGGNLLKIKLHCVYLLPDKIVLQIGFIVMAAFSAAVYFVFLCYMVWRVFCNISIKRTALPSMSNARRLHYEGIIYRFEFLMLATLLCAAMTVIGFILGQFDEGGHWKWDEDVHIQLSSAFLTGVYGMWNIYIFALIILYAPSHKKWPTDSNLNGNYNNLHKLIFFFQI